MSLPSKTKARKYIAFVSVFIVQPVLNLIPTDLLTCCRVTLQKALKIRKNILLAVGISRKNFNQYLLDP
jgi:hypothetical protein